MDIYALRLFLHLANSLHFGKTSRACHVSPSTLSRVIQRLEEEAGAPLFRRDRRSATLTAEGQAFRNFASSTIGAWEDLRGTFEGRAAQLTGELSIFCSVTAAYSLLPGLLTEFRERHPGIKVSILTGDANAAIGKVTSGETDLAIGPMPERPPVRVRARTIARTPLQLIAPKIAGEVSQALAAARINWGSVPVILPDAGIIRDRLLAWFRHKHVAPRVANEVAGHEAILALVSLGMGISAVPQLVLENNPHIQGIQVLDVRPRFPVYTVGISALKASRKRPVLEAFWVTAESIFP